MHIGSLMTGSSAGMVIESARVDTSTVTPGVEKETQFHQKLHHEICRCIPWSDPTTCTLYASDYSLEACKPFKLMGVIHVKTRPTSAPKDVKERVVWLDTKEPIERCFLVHNRRRHSIDEITCSEKSLIPIMKGKAGVN